MSVNLRACNCYEKKQILQKESVKKDVFREIRRRPEPEINIKFDFLNPMNMNRRDSSNWTTQYQSEYGNFNNLRCSYLFSRPGTKSFRRQQHFLNSASNIRDEAKPFICSPRRKGKIVKCKLPRARRKFKPVECVNICYVPPHRKRHLATTSVMRCVSPAQMLNPVNRVSQRILCPNLDSFIETGNVTRGGRRLVKACKVKEKNFAVSHAHRPILKAPCQPRKPQKTKCRQGKKKKHYQTSKPKLKKTRFSSEDELILNRTYLRPPPGHGGRKKKHPIRSIATSRPRSYEASDDCISEHATPPSPISMPLPRMHPTPPLANNIQIQPHRPPSRMCECLTSCQCRQAGVCGQQMDWVLKNENIKRASHLSELNEKLARMHQTIECLGLAYKQRNESINDVLSECQILGAQCLNSIHNILQNNRAFDSNC